ncbi:MULTISPECIES: beta-ketoacyl-[acyl-carrier-protein] synthase family protein [Actinoalloteichus]|uniref:3-oxoacyl-(Acyl-carrier-protein) synthase n=1 Tax=Actinoalloteichus fjordicus TaxID=1612552 RepID=A0AAC9L8I2_9PSEU|nr:MULTISPECIES: beta-ketoacyl-[acyl-carrier-protein] synthase family protein [Actinoalloteichus]APU13368.1 3-oxoacyl-(acyl-carrier-protein) synthase [Actinoalloteichus fjordicus]APU19318.1 3-oxoacyl-(acyl-carrier-protein) synthase [Actinoalloteichus sp. GBA129-24]
MSGEKVVVTGLGVFTAFGFGLDALLGGVFAGRAAFGPVRRFDVSRSRASHAAIYPADGPDSTRLAAWSGGSPGQRSVVLACARDALAGAGLQGPLDAALLLGTAGDDVAHTDFWSGFDKAEARASQETATCPWDTDGETTDEGGALGLSDCVPAHLAEDVARRLGLTGPTRAFVNACVASTNAIVHGAALIRSGRAHTVVCGGASLVGPHAFRNFDAAKALTKAPRMHPFSTDRAGLLLGDGAAMLVLESETRARRRGAEPLGRLEGWGMSADAHHLVRPDPTGGGAAASAASALCLAGVGPEQVDYVNAHGTATRSNDVAETAALHRVLGSHASSVPVSSTKGSTGHLLEATGAVELVIALLALREGMVPPTVGYGDPDPACDLDYVPEGPRRIALRRVLTVNSAVGGLNTAILVGRP